MLRIGDRKKISVCLRLSKKECGLEKMRMITNGLLWGEVTWPKIRCNDYTTGKIVSFKYVAHIMGLNDVSRKNF